MFLIRSFHPPNQLPVKKEEEEEKARLPNCHTLSLTRTPSPTAHLSDSHLCFIPSSPLQISLSRHSCITNRQTDTEMMVQGCESRRVLCWQILGHSCYVWRPSRLRMAMTMPSSAAAAVGLHSLITRSSLLSSCTNDTRGAAAVAAVFDSSSPGGSFSIGSPPSSFSFFTTSCNRSLTDGELFCRNAGLVDNLSASSSHDQVRFLAFSFQLQE